MQQNFVAMLDAARRQGSGRGVDPAREIGPGPNSTPPDNRRPVRKPAGGLDQQVGQVRGRDQPRGQRIGSRMET